MRTILITGGTGKLGRKLVAHFLGKGEKVIATGRSLESLEALDFPADIAASRLLRIPMDFTDDAASASFLRELAERQLCPDALVNSARSMTFLRSEEGGLVSRRNFMGELLVDVVAPYELTMALALHEGSRLRCVVNMGSQYGQVAANPALYTEPARQSPLNYSVAKAALAHLTRELAVRLANRNVRVNCVAFGGVEGRVDEAFRTRYAALCPLGRMLTEDEVAGPVEFLLSDASAGMTGQVIAVDGGWTIW